MLHREHFCYANFDSNLIKNYTTYTMQDDDITIDTEIDEGGDEVTPEAKIKTLRDKLKKSQAENAENLAGWQRAKADYVNLQKRMREAESDAGKAGVGAVVRDIVGIFDSLEAAERSAIQHGQMADGIVAVTKQLESILAKHGVIRFTPEVKSQFDPALHEPMQVVATNNKEEDNTLASVMQSGYTFHGITIRPARVSVFHFAE